MSKKMQDIITENRHLHKAFKILNEGIERYNSLTIVISRGSYELARKEVESINKEPETKELNRIKQLEDENKTLRDAISCRLSVT